MGRRSRARGLQTRSRVRHAPATRAVRSWATLVPASPAPRSMDYVALKLVHQAAVTLSITGFVARGAGALMDARWVTSRPAKSLPHVVDSVLLLSALTLA